MNAAPTKRWGRAELAAIGIIWLASAITWMRPYLLANEMVYLLPALQRWSPGTLATDWTWGGDLWRSTSALFGLLSAPLWAVSDRPEIVAMLGRALGWVVIAASIVQLGRRLGVKAGWTAFGTAMFILAGQGHAAGEWILLGFERKNFAHAAAILALAELIGGRTATSGAFVGLATAFHVLVGAWWGLAVGGGALLSWPRIGFRGVARLAVAALVVGVPFGLLAVSYLLSGDITTSTGLPADPERATWLTTVFRNPHHTLPRHFLDAGKMVRFVALSAATVLAARRTARPEAVRVVTGAVIVGAVAFVGGWAAGKSEVLAVLKWYPFRLADVLVPLLFWLLVPAAVHDVFVWYRRDPRTVDGRRFVAAVLAVGLAAWALAPRVPAGLRRVRSTFKSWPIGKHALADAGQWIRANTKKDAVFAVPPCEFDFWIRARRPAVVIYKAVPHGPRVHQWYERLRAVGGDHDPATTGFEVCKELQPRYAKLTADQLARLGKRYGARYYLLRGDRKDLTAARVYKDVRWAVYDIAAVAARRPPGASP